MHSAVTAAGGEVVNDLSSIGRLAARSDSGTFVSAVKANSNVAAVWTDRLITIDLVDASSETASINPTLADSTASATFVPWHDHTGPFSGGSLGNEDAPGVWQWDDDANGARGAREAGAD